MLKFPVSSALVKMAAFKTQIVLLLLIADPYGATGDVWLSSIWVFLLLRELCVIQN